MTVIVALRQDGQIWIGSDTQVTVAGDSRAPLGADGRKWSHGNGWAVACAGDGEMFSWIRSMDFGGHGFESICKLICDHMKEADYTKDSNQFGAPCYGNSFVIVVDGKIYEMDQTFCWFEIPEGELWARGSGREYALGAGYASRGMCADDRVRLAVEAASRYNIGCSGLWMTRLVPAIDAS